MGYFMMRSATGEKWHLEDALYELVTTMDAFNALPPGKKSAQTSWLRFAEVKGLAREVGAVLDLTLDKNDVIVPSSIGLDLYEDQQGALSFIPTCKELDDLQFRTVFERNDNAEGFYSLDQPGMGKLRIVLTDRQLAVLERMKRVRQVTGTAKEALKREPASVFDGLLGDVELPYSDRVIGIGDFQYASVPKGRQEESGFSSLWAGADPLAASEEPQEPSTEEVPPPVRESEGKKTLLISTHEEQIGDNYLDEAAKSQGRSETVPPFVCPRSLREDTVLKSHQVEGVRWLQTCTGIEGRQGILLADEMGVGKTLQILTFLAWAVESGRFPDLSSEYAPYRPILVIAPLILLETKTWEREIERFFEHNGHIFGIPLALYGPQLKAFRKAEAKGREDVLGEPTLDLDRLRKHKLVLTNYEAVRDYEFSFARYTSDGKPLWSIVVTDEAQEYKTPNTRISHAIKAIRPDFHIACTGTPVENRLLDLWNLFDAIQPGLLGSARAFTTRYDTSRQDRLPDMTADLQTRLLYRQPNAFLLRRRKEEVLDLPPKYEHKLRCTMSEWEIQRHRELVTQMGQTEKTQGKLNLLQSFARLYQHPALLGDWEAVPPETLLQQSAKLTQLITLLQQTRNHGQKAILFCRHKDMQRLLAKVLSAQFRIPVRIINGDTPQAGGVRQSGAETRKTILNEFQHSSGFNVLILSPFVAGVGITITEANHVIHYGRWWNPAVEAQATSRAHRIGQTREVHVYFLINQDPSRRIERTFDEVLDHLMDRKKELANQTLDADFLIPDDDEQKIGMNLFNQLATPHG
jgi:SNF2 family DNA or RNA helicase